MNPRLTLRSLLLAPSLCTLAALAPAQSYVETFDGGTNAGGWTYGNTNESIVATGGHPGAWLRNLNLDVFAPQCRTTGASVFTGDWRARGVRSFGIDLRTLSTQFPFQREATLMLSDASGCTVYTLGSDFVPQVAEGWKTFDYAIDADSTTIPAGWQLLDTGSGCSDADAAWNQVIQDVDQVTLFYGDPTFFFIFDVWQVGMDNARILEGVGTSYCTATANSTGAPALISASGSASVAANDLVLRATPVPAGQSGLFFYGSDAALVPFGNGFRCVAGAAGLGRLAVETASAGGVLEHALDNTQPPIPALQIVAGSTWRFQAWYRDPAAGGAFFDLSDGLEVVFVP